MRPDLNVTTDLRRDRQSLETAYRVDSQWRQLDERRMQTRQDTFGLAFGFRIWRALVKFVRLFERIQSFEQDFVDFRWRHAGFPLALNGLIVAGLWVVTEYIRVQVHKFFGLRFNFGLEPPPLNPSHNRGVGPSLSNPNSCQPQRPSIFAIMKIRMAPPNPPPSSRYRIEKPIAPNMIIAIIIITPFADGYGTFETSAQSGSASFGVMCRFIEFL